MIEIKDIGFSYGSRRVLDGISFDLRRNEVLSILGPNGVGKTTLLNCICNFNRGWDGEVLVDGEEVRTLNRRELAKRFGYVAQKCYPKRVTVFDSVLIGRRPYIDWTTTEEDEEIAWDAIEAMHLQDLALRYTDEISGGELQKVQIARAIVQQPKVIILDEPTNNLDVYNQHMTMNTIIDATQKRGISIIMTMHDINLSVQYSDTLLFLKGGEVRGYGDCSIVDSELIGDVYGMDLDVVDHEGFPFVMPRYSDLLLRHKAAFREQTEAR